MIRFIVRRVVRGFITLILFQTLLFALIHALPYDFSAFFLAGPAYRNLIRRQFGLDRPLWEQYGRWLLGFLRFDLGQSFQLWPTPVSQILLDRLPRTLILFMSAALIAYLLGIWLGKQIGWRRGGLFEFGVTLGGVAAYTSFAPWLGFLMINVFAWHLGLLPYQRLVNHNVWINAPVSIDGLLTRLVVTAALSAGTLVPLWSATRRIKFQRRRWAWRTGGALLVILGTWLWWSRSGLDYLARDLLAHLVLPLGSVVLLSFGETMMIMRMSMLETRNEDYVLMAQAKGLKDQVVRDRHVARNAILPVITRLGLNLPFVLIGSLVIERVFMWQAMGQVIFDAIEFQDIPVLLGILSVVGGLALIAHIVLDIVYAYLDPRVRQAGVT